MSIALSLVNLARTGWMLRGVPVHLAETVAEHSFLTAYVCLELASTLPSVDVGKLVLYSLVHDVSEAFTGDIVKSVSKVLGESKKKIEVELVNELVGNEVLKKAFMEFTAQNSYEARLAKLCNYIATHIMGLLYKKMGYSVEDILESTWRDIEELSKNLGVENQAKEILKALPFR